MLVILSTVLPVFGLILLGWCAVKTGYVSGSAGKALAEFAFKAAMPALLFRAMATSKGFDGSPLPLLGTYFGAMVSTWIIATLASRWMLRRPWDDSAAVAMGAVFGNTVMLGIPLALSAFGEAAAAPIALIVAIETPLMWLAATTQMELTLRRGGQASAARPGAAIIDFVRNPIVLSILLGVAWRATGLAIPDLFDRWLGLLAQSAAPAALFALGMSLATYRITGELPTLTAIGMLKLGCYPAIAYALATYVFEMPATWTAVAVLFAAMPVGANAYLFAQRYERAVGAVSGAMAVTTVVAVASLSAVLAHLGAARG